MRWALVLCALFHVACGSDERVHGRVTTLTPVAGALARALGCNTAGASAGGNFLGALGSDGTLAAGGAGQVLVFEAFAPSHDDAPPRFELRWLRAEPRGNERFRLDYDGYLGGDPAEGAKQDFGAVATGEDGWISAAGSGLELWAGAPLNPLLLEGAVLDAQIFLDGKGLAIPQATLTAYTSAPWIGADTTREGTGFGPCGEGGGCTLASVCVALTAEPLPPEQLE